MTEELKGGESEAMSPQAQKEEPQNKETDMVTTQSAGSNSPDYRDMFEKAQAQMQEMKILQARQSEELGQLRSEIRKRETQFDPQYQVPTQANYQPAMVGVPKYEDMFYENPTRAFQTVEERAKGAAIQEAIKLFEERQRMADYTQRFYRSNPDLDNDHGHTIVDLMVGRYRDDIYRLDPDERASFVARKAREFIRGISRPNGVVETKTMPDKAPIVEGSAPVIQNTQSHKEPNIPSFVEQVANRSQYGVVIR